jgi:tellurite resistance protein
VEIRDVLKTIESRRSFLIGLVFLSKADGIIDESEKIFFQHASNALELDEDSFNLVNACWSHDERPAFEFGDITEKKFFLREALQLCHVDGHYDEREKKMIREFASELGISDDILSLFENWVAEGIKWQASGDALVRGE